MANGGIVIVLFFVVLAASAAVFYMWPKGHDRNLVTTSIVLTLVCVYLMWAITYMAQLNPIIVPKRPITSHEGGH
ncbi:H(+)-transporting V0 sector ATPase subunit e [Blastocladiella emersonii ATCC 22665]|nr:H(+)-transporting V0 sector ATPase subunit e [Blastocladiella emersonii ATCC 22665]